MARPYWQHPKSLSASDDPDIRGKLRKGRLVLIDNGGEVIDKTALSYAEARALGFEDVEDPGGYGYGWHTENDDEFRSRQLLSMFVELGERPFFRPQEVAASAYYLWGDRLPVAREYWRVDQPRKMILEMLAAGHPDDPPSWAEIASLMKPSTRTGKPLSTRAVRGYVTEAAQKLNTIVPGLFEHMVEELSHRQKQLDAERDPPGFWKSVSSAERETPGQRGGRTDLIDLSLQGNRIPSDGESRPVRRSLLRPSRPQASPVTLDGHSPIRGLLLSLKALRSVLRLRLRTGRVPLRSTRPSLAPLAVALRAPLQPGKD